MKPVELKQIAEQATPGPWKLHEQRGCVQGERSTFGISAKAPIHFIVPPLNISEADCAHISTLNPELALKLCALWEAFEDCLNDLKDAGEELQMSQLSPMARHIKEAEQALKALEDHK